MLMPSKTDGVYEVAIRMDYGMLERLADWLDATDLEDENIFSIVSVGNITELTLPCDNCGTMIPMDTHKEELGFCLDCSNRYWNHESMDTTDTTDTTKRNRNANKTRVDYDLNIYLHDELNRWKLQVYRVSNNGHAEFLPPITLTQSEVDGIITGDKYFTDLDVWYGLDGFKHDKWNTLPDSLKAYFDALPIYEEDI